MIARAAAGEASIGLTGLPRLPRRRIGERNREQHRQIAEGRDDLRKALLVDHLDHVERQPRQSLRRRQELVRAVDLVDRRPAASSVSNVPDAASAVAASPAMLPPTPVGSSTQTATDVSRSVLVDHPDQRRRRERQTLGRHRLRLTFGLLTGGRVTQRLGAGHPEHRAPPRMPVTAATNASTVLRVRRRLTAVIAAPRRDHDPDHVEHGVGHEIVERATVGTPRPKIGARHLEAWHLDPDPVDLGIERHRVARVGRRPPAALVRSPPSARSHVWIPAAASSPRITNHSAPGILRRQALPACRRCTTRHPPRSRERRRPRVASRPLPPRPSPTDRPPA